jgi:hypothetical protein
MTTSKPSSLKTTLVQRLCENVMRLLPLILLGVCCVASADWQLLGKQTNGRALYIESDTIQKIGAKRRAWILENFAEKEDDFLSTISFIEFDCSEKKARLLQQDWHTELLGSGKRVTQKLSTESAWEYPVPNTAIYIVMQGLCKK